MSCEDRPTCQCFGMNQIARRKIEKARGRPLAHPTLHTRSRSLGLQMLVRRDRRYHLRRTSIIVAQAKPIPAVRVFKTS